MISLAFGGLLGLFYFGCLWLTLVNLPGIKHPFRLLISSFGLRILVFVFVFYLLSQSGANLILVLVGFFLIRTLLIYYLQPQ